MGPVVLAKNFTFALGSTSDIFRSDWVPVDAEFKNWNIHYHLQTLSPTSPTNGLTITVETSYDTIEVAQVGEGSATATGSANITPANPVFGMARLKLGTADTGGLLGTVSVWLQPQSE